jgi:hypothetical protein
MIFDMPSIYLSDDDWIYFLSRCLKGWTEIPLSQTNGYDKDVLKFYDGIIGLLLKQTERFQKMYPNALNTEFVNAWKYQGRIYRVIHSRIEENNRNKSGYSCRLPKVEYHGRITHWTTDYTFYALHKLSRSTKYIILEADTKEHIAFDINGFREKYECLEEYTKGEQEIIFPMYKECIKEYRMTINEFVEMKNKESC